LALNLEEHRLYLQDRVRLAAYRAAIKATVRPGQTVVDLAAGTGILGLLACEAGAGRVYAVDESGMADLARDLARANGFGERIEVIRGNAFRASLPQRVDLAITDQMGRFGFEAGLVQLLADARQRFLKPGGVTVPAAIDLQIAPVKCAPVASRLLFSDSRPGGFSYRAAQEVALNTGYPITFRRDDLLGAPALLARLNLVEDRAAISGSVSMPIETRGVLDGIGGWFTARLSPAVSLTNSPLSACAINRRNVFFPIARTTPVENGDVVRVEMKIMPANLIVAWRVEVRGRDGALRARSSHSTLRGMLLSGAGLNRLKSDYVPRLNRWGEARRAVVNLCDGAHAVSEIDAEIHRRYPDLFASLEQASVFVAEVVTRYGLLPPAGDDARGSQRYVAPRLRVYHGFAALTPGREPLEDPEVFGIAPPEG